MTKEPTEQALLVEYQSAQASAEHHDNLVWNVTNILWAASLVVFGFVLTKLGQPNLRVLLSLLSLIGVLLMSYAWFCALQFGFIRNQKYKRCKAIEAQLGLKQHTDLEHPKYFQRVLYAVLFMVMVVGWIFLIVFIWIS